ncbi:type I-F CRISPR-associated protein Csy3 [bacterium]|nr:type I-F CRISPR-associated protein Csy3 [bacterium]
MSKLKTASVLAFERKINNSDGLMTCGMWENKQNSGSWKPVFINEKAVRGTISNRMKQKDAQDPLNLDKKIENPNLQTVDVAALPFDCNTLKIEFTVRILNDFHKPSACNDANYQNLLEEKTKTYSNRYNCKELSLRYAENLVNGRFFWRNRLSADKIEIKVTVYEDAQPKEFFVFDALKFDLNHFSENRSADHEKLAQIIQAGLTGKQTRFLKVEAFALIGNGQEVYPSEELVLDKKPGGKSKILYSLNKQAALHSQKIGNALRTVDTWYPKASDFGPIAVEPYGAVTNRGIALRQPSEKTDFYRLFDNWICKNTELTAEEQHFVVACLIRGGVYGESDKESNKSSENE